MAHGIGQQVRHRLRNTRGVTANRSVKLQIYRHFMIGDSGAHLFDDLMQRVIQGRVRRRLDTDTTAKPCLGVQHDVLDQLAHAVDRGAHQRQNFSRFIRQWLAVKLAYAGIHCCN